MFVDSPTSSKLGACVKDGKPCELLMGCYTADEMKKYGFTYLDVSCRIGWECGRGVCCRYMPKEG